MVRNYLKDHNIFNAEIAYLISYSDADALGIGLV